MGGLTAKPQPQPSCECAPRTAKPQPQPSCECAPRTIQSHRSRQSHASRQTMELVTSLLHMRPLARTRQGGPQ
eukprot:57245-Chlamydomonas_euryale.AAC.3